MAKKILTALAALSMAMVGGTAMASPTRAPHEASIPFVNHGGIHDWRADGTRGVYVQDQHRRWYYARLMGPCVDLPFANSIGFETRGVDTLDKFGTLVVPGQRCAIQSFALSAAPPAKHAKKG